MLKQISNRPLDLLSQIIIVFYKQMNIHTRKLWKKEKQRNKRGDDGHPKHKI